MDKPSTNYTGVRTRKSKTRRHGVKFDECFFIRVSVDGKEIEESAGWASEGMTAGDAYILRSELKTNIKKGSGPRTLAEKQAEEDSLRKTREKAKREEAAKDITFKAYAEDQYFPIAEPGWKPETGRKHKEHCKTWLYPRLGDTPLRQIKLSHVNKVKAAMMKAERSPRTMQAVFRTFTMIWTSARDAEIVTMKAPTKKASFKLPKIDNERMRFLTTKESKALLKCVRDRSEQAADMALVSLESGLRFGEVATLTWKAVNLKGRALTLLNTKGKKDRIVPMTSRLHSLFAGMEQGKANGVVFPSRLGIPHKQVPSLFKRGLEDAKLNEGVEDRKMKASFHTLRHTFASRMVQQGVDLYKLQRILGHSTPALTARYAKLADEDLKKAVEQMETREKMKSKEKVGKVVSIHKSNG